MNENCSRNFNTRVLANNCIVADMLL
jgi:hypothetical protein